MLSHYPTPNNIELDIGVTPTGGAVNIQPVLLDTLVEFAPAYHVAPPCAAESVKDR